MARRVITQSIDLRRNVTMLINRSLWKWKNKNHIFTSKTH